MLVITIIILFDVEMLFLLNAATWRCLLSFLVKSMAVGQSAVCLHFRSSVITIRLGCEANVFLVDKVFLAHNIHEKLIE